MAKKFKSKHYRKWFFYGGLSAALMGFGLSLTMDAAFMKYNGANFWTWFLYGTVALSVFVSGMAFFGESVLSKVRYEKEQEKS